MAILQKRKDEQGRGAPESTPTRRVGSEAPIGSVTAGPSAGKSAAEFTQTQQGSPGSVFKRQLEGADIKGITSLAERPLAREAGQELGRVASEGVQYKKKRAEELGKEAQFDFSKPANTQDIINKVLANSGDYETAQKILGRSKIEVPAFSTRNIKEFTPLQALRGGTVEGLLQKEARGPYSTGMAGLDALLFRQKGGAAQLAGRGRAMQAGGQVFADVLQGRSSGVVPEATKTLLEKLGISVPSGNLTKEAQDKAAALVESQKSQLTEGLTSAQKQRATDYQTRLNEATAKRDAANLTARQQSEANARALAIQELQASQGILPDEKQAAIDAINKLDISQQLSPMFTGGQASLADVATADEENQYANLLNLLGLGGVEASAIKGMQLGKDTAGIFDPRAAITAEGFQQGERGAIDVMNLLREAGIGARREFARTQPGAYTPELQKYPQGTESSGQLPQDRDLGSARTGGGGGVDSGGMQEYLERNPRGRIA